MKPTAPKVLWVVMDDAVAWVACHTRKEAVSNLYEGERITKYLRAPQAKAKKKAVRK